MRASGLNQTPKSPKGGNMRRYETIYIIRPTANEDDINAIIDRTNGVIEKFGGSIIQLDRWGIKKLAYLIKKESQGYYVFTEYAGMPEAVNELERLFRIDEKTLKYMTIKTQEVYTPGPLNKTAVQNQDSEEDIAKNANEETEQA